MKQTRCKNDGEIFNFQSAPSRAQDNGMSHWIHVVVKKNAGTGTWILYRLCSVYFVQSLKIYGVPFLYVSWAVRTKTYVGT